MKKNTSETLKQLKEKFEEEKLKFHLIKDEKTKGEKELVIRKLEIEILEVSIALLYKTIDIMSDQDMNAVFENKLGKLTIELHKIKFPNIFMNPAILKSEEDRIVGLGTRLHRAEAR
jgi:hypothetical protein